MQQQPPPPLPTSRYHEFLLTVSRLPSCRLPPSLSLSFFCLSSSCEYRSTTITIHTTVGRDGHCWNLARPRGQVAFALHKYSRSCKVRKPILFLSRSLYIFPAKLVSALSVTHSLFYGYSAARKIFRKVARLTGPPRMQPPSRVSRDISVLLPLFPIFLARYVDSAVADYHVMRPGASA